MTKPERYSEILRRLMRRALTDAAAAQARPLGALAGMTRDQMFAAAGSLGLDVATIQAAAKAEWLAQNPNAGTGMGANGPAMAAEWQASAANRDDDNAQADDAQAPADDAALAQASADPLDAAAERDFNELAGLWANMDPIGFKTRLRELTILANKPAVEIVREVIVHAPGAGAQAPTVSAAFARPALPVSKRIGQTTSAELFGIAGKLGTVSMPVYDGTQSPAIDPDYVWIDATGALLACLFRHGKPIWLAGPAGTGKTSWAEQLAARLGRPFVRLTCTATTEAATLLGMTVPSAGGGVTWQDGSLTAALRKPGAIILIDEPTVARSGSLYAFQSLLDGSRAVTIEETGERVAIHDDAVFIFADNTNGSGDTSGHYVGTGPISAALINRMGALELVDYLPAAAERAVLRAKTTAPAALATLLVDFARITRTKATSGDLSAGLGLRSLLSWAERLMDGVPADQAAHLAFINAAPADTVPQLLQLLATHAPAGQIDVAAGNAPPPDATPQPAAHDDATRHGFTSVTDI